MKVRVRVTPKARKVWLKEINDNEFFAAVRECAERNEANARVQTLVTRHFNVPLTSVRFLMGARSKSKLFDVVQ